MKLAALAIAATLTLSAFGANAAVGSYWDRTHSADAEVCIATIENPKSLGVPRWAMTIHPASNDEYTHIEIVSEHPHGTDRLMATCQNGDVNFAIVGGTMADGRKVSRIPVGIDKERYLQGYSLK